MNRFHPFVPLLLAGLAAGAGPAGAQSCGESWSSPVVCRVELVLVRPGERRGKTLRGDTLTLPARGKIELHVEATDQWGRRFPEERFDFGLDLRRDCGDLFELERVDGTTVRLETGPRTGDCEGTFWVANNTNFDRPIRFRVERSKERVYSRREAEFIARALYRAILDREGESEGVASAALAIQRSGLDDQVHAMLQSSEFARLRSRLSAQQILQDLYRGILGREPDTAGVRSYLPRVERGELAGVALTLLASDEFEQRLYGATR